MAPEVKRYKRKRQRRRPNWLPEGWKMDVGMDQNGKEFKFKNKLKLHTGGELNIEGKATTTGSQYFTSPESAHVFHSRQEVLQYLKVSKDDHVSDMMIMSTEQEKPNTAQQVGNSLKWLPHGWILEIKTRLSGDSEGRKYKCYLDPFSGSRFYSKEEVLRFLKSRKQALISGEKRDFKASVADNVLAHIEYSPDGLPHGWIKETSFRKSKHGGAKRDAILALILAIHHCDGGINAMKWMDCEMYYTDPVSGYVFRSLKDAIRYVETGKLSRNALGPGKRSINEMYSLETEPSPPTAAKRLKNLGSTTSQCLFTEGASTSNGEMAMDFDESPEKLMLPPPEHVPSKSEHTEVMANKKRRNGLRAATNNPINTSNSKHVEQKGKIEMLTGRKYWPAMEPKEMQRGCDELLTRLKLIPPEHTSSKSFPKVDIGNTAEKANEKRSNNGLVQSASNHSLKTCNHGEQKAKNKSSRSLKKREDKASEEVKTPSEPSSNITPAPQERKQQSGKAKKITLPSRSSKRLAGLDPEPSTDLVIHYPSSRRSISNAKCNEVVEKSLEKISPAEEKSLLLEGKASAAATELAIHQPMPNSEGNGSKESAAAPLEENQNISGEEGSSLLLKGKTCEEERASSSSSLAALPFGDIWADPCIEFAVKTLLGEIPVLDEGILIEEYFRKQLSTSVTLTNPSATSATAAASSDNPAGPDQTKRPQLPVNHEGKACPSENSIEKATQDLKRLGL